MDYFYGRLDDNKAFKRNVLSACVTTAIIGMVGTTSADEKAKDQAVAEQKHLGNGFFNHYDNNNGYDMARRHRDRGKRSFDYYKHLDKDGEYLTGDFHNHTTCSDGSTSVKTLTRKSLTYLDWFIHVGHSGSGSRDCRIDDFLYINRSSEFNAGLWVNSLPGGSADIKGDPTFRTMANGSEVQKMWRWQSLQEFNLGGIVEEREKPGNDQKAAFLGLEWVVPGHEHASNAISTGQYGAAPNSDALAEFEYCFARNSDDTSQGGGQDWTCEISEEGNEKLKALFDGRPEEGTADYNSTLGEAGINIEDAGEHVKSTAAILWMQENFPGESFSAQAHVERQGAYIPDDDEGYNIEHLRDWNTVGPDVAFGFESQPGHQAVRDRGSYAARRPTAGLWTYGGTGCYAGAEAAKPGMDFEGEPLDPATFEELGITTDDPAKVVLCRPGVRTMWDAMLSEGRHYWFFASSDWHSRGEFGPLDYESTVDFWPGEYQEQFTWIEDNNPDDPAKDIIDGLRSGNSYAVQGQLIDKLLFKACSKDMCATMGETLEVSEGDRVYITMFVRDPKGANNSPYKFYNPSLMQIGIKQPINMPKLAQVDMITGVVTGPISPSDPEYKNPLAPETTHITASWGEYELGKRPLKRMKHHMRVTEDMYIRARGSNIPAGTPHERDMYGNPLPDNHSDYIPCDDPACPPHIMKEVDGAEPRKVLDADVEAWADVWFYTNPIFIKVK